MLTRNPLDVEKIYRIAVFNILAHDRDDHAKNFSFLMDEEGKWTVSPAYDLTCSHALCTGHATSVMDEYKNPGEKHLRKLGQYAHISDAKINRIIIQTRDALSQWQKLAKDYGILKEKIAHIQNILNQK